MVRRKRIKWENGAIFAVPLVDGTYGFAQAIDHWMPHWIYVAVFNVRLQSLPEDIPNLTERQIVSLVAVSDDELDFGEWPLVGHAKPLVSRRKFPNERFKRRGYVGARSYEAGLIAEFLSAYHCLTAWNDWHAPDYLDTLLLSSEMKPKKLIYKKNT